jgi:hypothetical protein
MSFFQNKMSQNDWATILPFGPVRSKPLHLRSKPLHLRSKTMLLRSKAMHLRSKSMQWFTS